MYIIVIAIAIALKIQSSKGKIKNAKKDIKETWNDKLKTQDDIFWRY